MKLISNKLYEQYTKEVIGFHQYIPNITKEQLYEVFKFHCANLRVLDEVVEYYSGLQQENQRLKEQLQQKEDIINKIEDYLIKNNLFSYKYDEEELFEIVTDKIAKNNLLDLLKEIK